MALQIDLTAAQNPIGIDLPTVYCRVMAIRATDTDAWVVVNFYATADARTAQAVPVQSKEYHMTGFDLVNPVSIKSFLYGGLKRHPDFANAVDV